MKATIAMIALAISLGTAGCARAAPPDPGAEHALAARWPAGASGTVLAVRDGRIALCRGIGAADRAAHVAATCDTVYDLMSMTKQFTAAAVLKLETMGRLRTTDPIARFVGSVPPDKQAITIQQLLAHTSGLTEALGDDYDRLSRRGFLRGALASRLRSAPGAEYHYSNVGYSLLAAIVERASGTSYERFLARHLFAPAGMRQTGYVLPRWRRDRVAVEYDARGRSHGTPLDHPWAADGPWWNLRGNGGMLSTARDMFRWHRALQGDAILSSAAKRELFAPRAPVTAPGYEGFSSAYGWGLLSTPDGRVAAHTGGNGWSFGVVARFLDDGRMVFWVSNHARQVGRWNLERLDQRLTFAIADGLGRPRRDRLRADESRTPHSSLCRIPRTANRSTSTCAS